MGEVAAAAAAVVCRVACPSISVDAKHGVPLLAREWCMALRALLKLHLIASNFSFSGMCIPEQLLVHTLSSRTFAEVSAAPGVVPIYLIPALPGSNGQR